MVLTIERILYEENPKVKKFIDFLIDQNIEKAKELLTPYPEDSLREILQEFWITGYVIICYPFWSGGKEFIYDPSEVSIKHVFGKEHPTLLFHDSIDITKESLFLRRSNEFPGAPLFNSGGVINDFYLDEFSLAYDRATSMRFHENGEQV